MKINRLTKKFLAFFLFAMSSTQAQEDIVIGQKLMIESNLLNDQREIWISLPESYNDTIYSPKTYPVCYFFDGDSHFLNLVAQSRKLSKGLYAATPEMIMVGILQKDRPHELTPTNMKTPEEWKKVDFSTSGGNNEFLGFIQNELKPYINTNFRTNTYEILIGHSFGGLAVMNSFIQFPAYYDAYVSLDASMWWDDEILLKKIQQNWNPVQYSRKTLYFAKANDDGSGASHHDANLKFNELFKKLNATKTVRYHYQFYENEDHGTIVIPGEFDALQYIFQGYELPVKQIIKKPKLLINHYREVSKNLGYEILPDEKLIDDLARVCERQELFDQALEMLRINYQFYPDSNHAKIRFQKFKEKDNHFIN